MYYSNVLLKSYKTIGGLKTQLKRELKKSESELLEIQKCIYKGWDLYLGEPIYQRHGGYILHIYEIKRELKHAEYL